MDSRYQEALRVTADPAAREVVVWTPTTDAARWPITTENLSDLRVTAVSGGRIIVARAERTGCYAVHVGAHGPSCPPEGSTTTAPSDTTTTPSPTGPAAPHPKQPSYTG